jgi:hypothetical protein
MMMDTDFQQITRRHMPYSGALQVLAYELPVFIQPIFVPTFIHALTVLDASGL